MIEIERNLSEYMILIIYYVSDYGDIYNKDERYV